MSIEDRLADADILWKHGRHEGALLSVLVAVAATARKTFPEITGDRASYQYLVESIRRFPDQETFAAMIRTAGFEQVAYRNLSMGIAALHSGWKI